MNEVKRFFNFFLIDKPSKCWNWLGVKNLQGYGKFSQFGRTFAAHRTSYEMHKGPIPSGQVVRHACDNPSCVNPSHLLTGTRHDNMADMVARGRHLEAAKRASERIRAIEICRNGHRYDEVGVLWQRDHRSGKTIRLCRECARQKSARANLKLRAEKVAA